MKKQGSLQDVFLNGARKNKIDITVFLVNGVPVKGRVVSFDQFTILLDCSDKQNLIYKHAISTIVPEKKITYNAGE